MAFATPRRSATGTNAAIDTPRRQELQVSSLFCVTCLVPGRLSSRSDEKYVFVGARGEPGNEANLPTGLHDICFKFGAIYSFFLFCHFVVSFANLKCIEGHEWVYRVKRSWDL